MYCMSSLNTLTLPTVCYKNQKYNLSINMADLANSLSFGSAVVLTPIAGIIITKTGYYLFWLLSPITVMTLPGLLTFMFSDGNSYILYIAGILK